MPIEKMPSRTTSRLKTLNNSQSHPALCFYLA